MGIPTLTGFNTALSGLEAMQTGLDTTSNNISNASNPDYADEIVNTGESSDYIEYDGGISTVAIGTGSTVENVEREDNPFLDAQYYQANAAASNSSTVYNQLSNFESDLDTSSTSGNLASAVSSFFSAWNSYSTETTSSSSSGTAQAVVSTGEELATQLNSISGEISTLQTQAGAQLSSLTGSGGEVQNYTNEIAQYNTEIAQATAAGQSPNSLEDQRATAIDGLSSLISLNVTQQSDGSVNITLNNGSSPPTPLITGGTVTLPSSYSAADGGEIGALSALSDTTASDPDAPLAQLQSDLDTVANQINSALPSGSPSFFTASTGTGDPITAANIQVNSSWTTAAVQGVSSSDAEGVFNNESEATDSYSAFVTQVGDTVDGAQDTNSTNQALLTQVSNQRQSVSGVSLDQEMTNLISYQQGYEASAKVMSTMQTVIQTLIESVGSSGV
jgi:flagellar hook-associated protein 1 FlgK